MYNIIINFMQEILNLFTDSIVSGLVEVLKIDVIMTTIGSLVIIMFAVKKVQEGDLFSLKNMFGIILMIVYLGFFNWAVQNPATYTDGFKSLISYPAEAITQSITASTASIYGSKMQAVSGNYKAGGGVDVMIDLLIDSGLTLLSRAWEAVGFTDAIGGTLIKMLPPTIYLILMCGFIIAILGFLIIVGIQILLWSSLTILMIPLAFLPQTRGMIGKYTMHIAGLTMYAPLIVLIATFQVSISEYVVNNMPDINALEKGIFEEIPQAGVVQGGTNMLKTFGTVIGYYILICVSTILSTTLLKQIPDFINTVMGAGGNVGKGLVGAVQQATGRIAGGTAAVAGAGAVGAMKSGYQNAGGGIGGLLSAGLGGSTMGLSSLIGKGANKLGIKGAGEKLNDKINSSSIGKNINQATSSGITAGSNAIKKGAELAGLKK